MASSKSDVDFGSQLVDMDGRGRKPIGSLVRHRAAHGLVRITPGTHHRSFQARDVEEHGIDQRQRLRTRIEN